MSNDALKEMINTSSEDFDIFKKGGRPKGSTKDVHKKDRDIIFKRLEFILGIRSDKKEFCVNDIDNDDEKINQILYMIDDIKKYFKCGRWSYFRNLNGNQPKKPYLSLVKSIYCDFGYESIQNVIKEKKDGVVKKRTYIVFVKK